MVHAIDNRNPFSGAYVLARDIVGSGVGVAVYAARVVDGTVELRLNADD